MSVFLRGRKHKAVAIAQAATTGSNINLATALVTGQAIDGVTLADGDLVLVKDQTDAKQNGLYRATATGGQRYFSTPGDLGNLVVLVEAGSTLAGRLFRQTTLAPVVGSSNIAFAQLGGIVPDGSVPMAGDLDMDGNKVINLDTPTAADDAATKAYVDSQVGGSIVAGLNNGRLERASATTLDVEQVDGDAIEVAGAYVDISGINARATSEALVDATGLPDCSTDTAQNTANGDFDNTTDPLVVDNTDYGNVFVEGKYYKIGTELLYCDDVTGDVVTLSRGALGTTNAAHANGADIYSQKAVASSTTYYVYLASAQATYNGGQIAISTTAPTAVAGIKMLGNTAGPNEWRYLGTVHLDGSSQIDYVANEYNSQGVASVDALGGVYMDVALADGQKPRLVDPRRRRYCNVEFHGQSSTEIIDTNMQIGTTSSLYNSSASDGDDSDQCALFMNANAGANAGFLFQAGAGLKYGKPSHYPSMYAEFSILDANPVTHLRAWVGLTDQTPATMLGATDPAGNYVGFHLDIEASETTWHAVLKDGVTQTRIDTGIDATVPAVTRLFEIYRDARDGKWVFLIDGVEVARSSTNAPAESTITIADGLGSGFGIRSVSGAGKTCRAFRCGVTQR